MNFKSNETIWSQIIEYVKKKIFSGAFACGQRLPAIRDFAVTCRVNPNTVVRVYAQLEEEGLIYTGACAEEMRGAGVGKQELERLIREALPEEK